MDIIELIKMYYDEGILAVIACLVVIQITPIKCNPISTLFEWIGKKINKEVIAKVDRLENTLNEHIISEDKEAAVSKRVRILRFSNEVREGKEFSKEMWDQTLLDIDVYEKYCISHPDFKNSITVHAIDFINDEYDERLDTNNFLQ